MQTALVERPARSPQPQRESEDVPLQSTLHEQGSLGSTVAMVACNVALLLMLAACSP